MQPMGGSNLVKEIPLVNGVYGTPVVLGPAFTFKNPFGVAGRFRKANAICSRLRQ